jgi:DNA/RNA-binding domain of Phe-tRNA-synthetase-like protein
MTVDLHTQRGWVAAELAEEFPQLAIHQVRVEAAAPRRSPRPVKQRLRMLSDRYTGGKAVNIRQEPVPWAYRVFFRQIGIDPDERRTPPEEIALERMKWGGFASHSLLDDALTIATVETGVALVAFDADRVEGELGVRLSRPGERLGVAERLVAGAAPLSARQIVIADASRSLAILFGQLAEGRGVHPRTTRMVLCGIQVKGVPQVSVEEALWTVAEVLATGQEGAAGGGGDG